MAKLGSDVKSMQKKCCLADDHKELPSFRKATDEIGQSLGAIKDATKVCTCGTISVRDIIHNS